MPKFLDWTESWGTSLEINIADAIREIEVWGFTKLEQAIEQPEALAELLRLHAINESKLNKQLHAVRSNDRYVYNLQNKDVRFLQLLSIPSVKGILKHFLNDPYYQVMDAAEPNYILNYFNARSSGDALDLHIDCKFPATGQITWVMQVAFVLEDMTLENGCTQVVPGSHKSGEYTDRQMLKRQPIEAKAGDIVLWDSRLWHGTGENLSGGTRWVAIATVTQWWMKQNLDIPRMLPDEIYQQCTDDEKVLLGFASIPPVSDADSVITKKDKSFLKRHVSDYFK
jgi:hypothetical protein